MSRISDAEAANIEEEGFDAGKFGEPESSCPFGRGTKRAMIWLAGWSRGIQLYVPPEEEEERRREEEDRLERSREAAYKRLERAE